MHSHKQYLYLFARRKRLFFSLSFDTNEYRERCRHHAGDETRRATPRAWVSISMCLFVLLGHHPVERKKKKRRSTCSAFLCSSPAIDYVKERIPIRPSHGSVSDVYERHGMARHGMKRRGAHRVHANAAETERDMYNMYKIVTHMCICISCNFISPTYARGTPTRVTHTLYLCRCTVATQAHTHITHTRTM